jgi:hypothetical protein
MAWLASGVLTERPRISDIFLTFGDPLAKTPENPAKNPGKSGKMPANW